MSFPNNLRYFMEEKQISQSELAERIGKGKSSICQYLSGKNIPRADTKERLADALGCSIEDLDVQDEKECSGNVSVAECARIIGKSEQFVRVALQTGVAPFGFAVKNKSVYSYHISRKLLTEYAGASLQGR